MAQLDPTQFIGLTGVPLVEQVVQYLKDEWRMPSYLAPLAALAVGVALNVAIGHYMGTDFLTNVCVGLFTGFSSSFWHEMSKKAPTVITNDPTE